MAAVKRGVGREQAHEAIREHAVAVALQMRGGQGGSGADLLERLAGDNRLGLTRADLEAIVSEPLGFTGAATAQVDAVIAQVADLAAGDPEAAAYEPGAIL